MLNTGTSATTASVWVNRIGLVGLCLFLVFCWLGTALANLGLGLMLIALLVSLPANWSRIKVEPLLLLFLLFCLYLLLRTLWALWEFPEIASLHIHDSLKWLHLWAFMLVGWWQYQSQQQIYPALAMLLIGFVASVLYLTDWESCRGFLDGVRCGFGFQIIMGGLLVGSALLGLLIFAPKLIGAYRLSIVWFLRLGIWFTLLLASVQVVISTQTRSVWMGLSILLPMLLLARYWQALRGMLKGENRPGLILALVALISSVGILSSNEGVLDDRLLNVKDNVAAMIATQFDRVEAGDYSVAGRLFMTKAGIDKWLERPIFGWGTGVNAVEFFPDLNEKVGEMTHLHNTYVEMLVRMGLVGAAFYVFAVLYLIRGIFNAYRRGLMEKDVFVFLVGIFGLLMIWCITDYQLQSTDWRFYWLVMFGISLSFAIGQRRAM